MTLDEAINILKQYVDYDNPDVPDFYTMEEAIKVIIKALEQQTTDAVSRQAVIDTLTKTSGIRGDALKALYDLPSVTPQPKMGHWIKCIDDNGSSYYLCSACRCGEDFKFDWCPNCGTKMQEVNG